MICWRPYLSLRDYIIALRNNLSELISYRADDSCKNSKHVFYFFYTGGGTRSKDVENTEPTHTIRSPIKGRGRGCGWSRGKGLAREASLARW